LLKKTASQIARSIGVTRQATSKRLRKLKKEGIIEVDEAETTLRRQQNCSREIIYRLTDKGRILLLNSQHSQRSDLRELKIRPLAGRHNVTFKIRHNGHGLLPAGCKKKRNFNNWTPHYGWYNDCYWETTPKHIIIKTKARAENEERVWQLIYEKLYTTWKFFKQLGWLLDNEAIMIHEGKKEVIGLLKNHSYEEGEQGIIDSTPEPATIHPKHEGDVDRIINMAHFIEKNGDKLEELPDAIMRLTAEIKMLRETILGQTYEKKRTSGPEVG